jgi:hypothetical protein
MNAVEVEVLMNDAVEVMSLHSMAWRYNRWMVVVIHMPSHQTHKSELRNLEYLESNVIFTLIFTAFPTTLHNARFNDN